MGKGRPTKVKHNSGAGAASSSSRLWVKLPPFLQKHAIWVLAAVVLLLALLVSQGYERWSSGSGVQGQSKAKSRASRKPPPYKGSLGYFVREIYPSVPPQSPQHPEKPSAAKHPKVDDATGMSPSSRSDATNPRMAKTPEPESSAPSLAGVTAADNATSSDANALQETSPTMSSEDASHFNVASFLKAAEVEQLSGQELYAQHLKGASHAQKLRALKGAVEASAPLALSAVGSSVCPSEPDATVAELLASHHRACRYSQGLAVEVTNAIQQQRPPSPPSDFPRKCAGHCLRRLKEVVAPLAEEYEGSGEPTVPLSFLNRAFTNLCSPVLEALLEACGPRTASSNNRSPGSFFLDASAIAKGHASAGNLPALLKLHNLGYQLVNEDALGGDLSKSHAPHELILRGHLSSAASLLAEAPHLKDTLDAYGNRPEKLLGAQTNLKGDVSLEWASLREIEGTQAHSSSAAEDEDDDHAGGWPSEEISFPGWPYKDEDENDDASTSSRLRCEFTEVSGAAVAEEPVRFVKELVLKSKPVVIRDLVRHDARGLAPLLEALKKQNLLGQWGSSSWEAGSIPYSSAYKSEASPTVMTLSEYAATVIGDGEADRAHSSSSPENEAPPPYIFAESKPLGSERLVDIFPEVPEWAERGIPNLVRLRKGSAQFYLGSQGTGAPMHYHTNPAWNALIHGKKGWVLLPPSRAAFSSVAAAESAEARSTQDGALRCEQGPGDVMVVPSYWGHLTYNLRASVGIAKEFHIDALRKKAPARAAA